MARIVVCLLVLALPSLAFAQSRVAAPTFSVGGGDYSTVVLVRIRVGTPDATIRFTQNGMDPTESDPVIVSGSMLAINTSLTLKARAWKAGWQPSAVRSATYRIASGAAPVIGPGDVAAGLAHSVVVTPAGGIFTWLRNRPPAALTPAPLLTAVDAGAQHTLAIAQNGDVYAWGSNASGQLGDGTLADRETPQRVAGLANVVHVAAGRAHSLALTSEGHVYAWGANVRGQLGIGMGAEARVPTLIPSLSDIASIDAGNAYSLAVTRTGGVFAWGANGRGQLGDGSRTRRPRPVRINLTGVVQVAAGARHTLALVRDGSVYAWGDGARGELGTGSLEIATHPTRVSNLDADAVRAGRWFSAAIRRDGSLVMWGANDLGQLGDGSFVDRSRPVPGPSVGSIRELSLGGRHTIAATATGDIWTWGRNDAPSAEISGLADWGPQVAPEVLNPPSITPASGAYSSPQTVTIAGDGHAGTVRYTIDGSDPTVDSPAYSTPFVVTATATVKARVYSQDASVQPSDVALASYVIDASPPTIVATVSPPASGPWHSTPATVSFLCADDSGTVSCPGPVTVSQDGPSQVVSGTATDPVGNQATATVTLSIDQTPPSVVVANAPDDGVTTAAQLLLTGRAFDDTSGLASGFRCNGVAVAVLQETFECLVALRPGVNSIALQARDNAGNMAATGLVVTRVGTASSLTMTPDARTMVANEVATLSLHDDFGAAVPAADWMSSDPTVATLSDADPPVVTARAPGTATITATKDGLTAESTITVDAALVLPPGTVRWNISPTPGFAIEAPIFTHRVDPSVPDMFIFEAGTGGEATLRAVTSEGTMLWRQDSPGVPLMGDSFGGVIAGVPYDAFSTFDFKGLARLGDAGGVPPWRYESPGVLLRPAQAPDGTLYAVEYMPEQDIHGDRLWDKHVIVIDGKTGGLLHRHVLPRDVEVFNATIDGNPSSPLCSSIRSELAPDHVGPMVGGDGHGYVLVRRRHRDRLESCVEGTYWPQRTIDNGVDLIRLPAGAAPVVEPIFAETCDVPRYTQADCDLPPSLQRLMSDGMGGVLALWDRGTLGVPESMISRRAAEGALTHRRVEDNSAIDRVGQNGVVYLGAASAYDVVTGETRWTRTDESFIPMAATPDGGLALLDTGSQQLHQTDAMGVIVSSEPFALDFPAVHELGQWIGYGYQGLKVQTGLISDATRWSDFGGNRQRQLAARTPGVGIFAKSHPAITPLLAFDHVSIRITPTFQGFWQQLKPADFVNRDEYGNYFMTLGAGTAAGDTSLLCTGTLTKGINRDKDVTAPPVQLEPLPIGPFDETRIINDLYVAFDGYKNDLPYACVPEMNPGHYNSNSFASGLLRKVGAPLPLFPTRSVLAPGWATPVPPEKFGPQ